MLASTAGAYINNATIVSWCLNKEGHFFDLGVFVLGR